MSSPEPELPPLGVPPPPMSHYQVVQHQVQSCGLVYHGLQCAFREVWFPPPDISKGMSAAAAEADALATATAATASEVSHLAFPSKKMTTAVKATSFTLIPEMV